MYVKCKLKAYEPEQLEVVVDHEEIVGGSSNEQKFRVEDKETIADCLDRMKKRRVYANTSY